VTVFASLICEGWNGNEKPNNSTTDISHLLLFVDTDISDETNLFLFIVDWVYAGYGNPCSYAICPAFAFSTLSRERNRMALF